MLQVLNTIECGHCMPEKYPVHSGLEHLCKCECHKKVGINYTSIKKPSPHDIITAIDKASFDMANYNQHDHVHCFSVDNPPCGQKIKH